MSTLLEESSEPNLRPKRRQADSELDITPLIDIVFLLLAFFVVVSKMDPKAFTDLPFAKNGKSVATQNAVVLIVGRAGETAEVFGGERKEKTFTTTGDDLYKEVVDYVKNETEANPNIMCVVIKAEKGVKNRFTDPVFRAAKEGAPDGWEIRTGVEEKK